jgi:hypothetical protein
VGDQIDARLAEIRRQAGGRDVWSDDPVSHHLAYLLRSGRTIFADYRTPFVVDAIRRINAATMNLREPADADRDLIERWARQCPSQVCYMPFTECNHEE